jgi:putative transposase
VSIFGFIRAEKANHPVAIMCRLLGVSRSGFYAWVSRPISVRRHEDSDLASRICRIHDMSRGTYGAPRIHAELRADGVRVGRKRVARLMGLEGLEGIHRRRFRATTIRDLAQAPAADLVEREFTADRPDRLWVADLTYVRTWAGWLYVSAVVDAFSRMVVGWSMRDDLRSDLAVDAIQMALYRRVKAPGGLVHHSDSETVGAGVPWVPDPHGDGHARMLVPGAPGFLTRTPIDELLSFLGYVGPLGAPGEALRLTVGVT